MQIGVILFNMLSGPSLFRAAIVAAGESRRRGFQDSEQRTITKCGILSSPHRYRAPTATGVVSRDRYTVRTCAFCFHDRGKMRSSEHIALALPQLALAEELPRAGVPLSPRPRTPSGSGAPGDAASLGRQMRTLSNMSDGGSAALHIDGNEA